jgi:hypothetical protein
MTKYLFIAASAVLLPTQAQAQNSAPAQAQGAVQAPAAPQSGLRGNWLQADITRQQAQQRADSMFQRLDANHDGALTRDEALKAGPQTGRGGARVERLMARLFADAQSVTQAQFEAQALARFDAQDANRDGTVTADERQQARAARQQAN